ncbi:MAG: hypothetical protein WD601_08875 [Pseudohongiellaceae bacterium]
MQHEDVFEQARILLDTKLSELKVRGFSRLVLLADREESEHVDFGRILLRFSSRAQVQEDGTLAVLTEARHVRFFRKSDVTALGFYVTRENAVSDMTGDDLERFGYKGLSEN